MEKVCEIVVLLFLVLCSFISVKSDLTIEGTKCGQKICNRSEYCSPYHNSCEPCSDVCNKLTHNYDESQCEKKCQDYLHDSRYARKDDTGNGDENLKATVQKLSYMVTVTLTLVSFMLVVLGLVFAFQLYRWKQKKNITLANIRKKLFSKKCDSATKENAVTHRTTNEKPDLHLEIPTESMHSGNSPITTTTSISRKPAEDSALDYAYDNPAMSSSPNNKTNSNAF